MVHFLSDLMGWEQYEDFISDCRNAFAIQTDTGNSFWLAHDRKPRCGLEALASAVYKRHRKTLHRYQGKDEAKQGEDEATDGASKTIEGTEWWVQIRGDRTSDKGDAIGFHWDRDEELADVAPSAGRRVVHPTVATVTYLTGTGAPTVVVNQKVIPMPTTARPTEAFARQGFISHPAMGKHIAFDGRFLHGVPPELMLGENGGDGQSHSKKRKHAAVTGGTSGLRVTFLVNVWSGHQLRCAGEYPEAALSQLKVSAKSVRQRVTLGKEKKRATIASEEAAIVDGQRKRVDRSIVCGQDRVCGFVFGRPDDEAHELWMPMPTCKMHAGETIAVQFSPPGARVVRHPPAHGATHGGGGKRKASKKRKKKK